VAQTISEVYAERGELAASFFFSRGSPSRNSIDHVFPTIVYQFAMSWPNLRHRVIQIVENDPSVLYKETSVQFEELIVESCRHREDVLAPFLVVIDGLDECSVKIKFSY
jgi:hypothetical protein